MVHWNSSVFGINNYCNRTLLACETFEEKGGEDAKVSFKEEFKCSLGCTTHLDHSVKHSVLDPIQHNIFDINLSCNISFKNGCLDNCYCNTSELCCESSYFNNNYMQKGVQRKQEISNRSCNLPWFGSK